MRAQRAEKFGHGGGPIFWWGGTQDFHDGGGQVLMGGYIGTWTPRLWNEGTVQNFSF